MRYRVGNRKTLCEANNYNALDRVTGAESLMLAPHFMRTHPLVSSNLQR